MQIVSILMLNRTLDFYTVCTRYFHESYTNTNSYVNHIRRMKALIRASKWGQPASGANPSLPACMAHFRANRQNTSIIVWDIVNVCRQLFSLFARKISPSRKQSLYAHYLSLIQYNIFAGKEYLVWASQMLLKRVFKLDIQQKDGWEGWFLTDLFLCNASITCGIYNIHTDSLGALHSFM